MRHHLYARFITMALYDLGLVPFPEPFPHLRLHGLLVYEGAKMSKSRGNVVNPDQYIAQVGADTLRLYLLFCGPWEEGGDFSDASLAGIVRFIGRLWKVVQEGQAGAGSADMSELDRSIARIQEATERFRFNSAIARLMELLRWLERERSHMSATQWERAARTMILLIAPFAPHLAEELWQRLGRPYSVHVQEWPAYDPAALAAREVEIVVQINGRLRGRFQGSRHELTKEDALKTALALPEVMRHLDGKIPRQVFYVPGRLLNLVV
jgi:leucyl-tRNA synthetase